MTRVLVVDDEPRIVSFVSRALAAEGFRVDGAQDGLRGLDLARTGRYELVVLDLLLPGMDGVTLLRRLIEERPQQRVLVLSAFSDVQEKVSLLGAGRLRLPVDAPLLADVWRFGFDAGSNLVDVCVGRLRAKLGAYLVETVRNVGYRFDAA